MEDLVFTIDINAPKQHVWNTMLHPETYKEWVEAAWPNSYYEGEWKQGENVRFIGTDGSGTLANLVVCKPYDHISARHIAVLLSGGIEDRDSEVAKGWIGTTEAYTVTEQNDGTQLKVVLTINPEWAAMFNEGWPKALAKLKEVCERKD